MNPHFCDFAHPSGFKVNTDLNEKVDISRILIHPVDGTDSKARVTAIEAANSVLSTWVKQSAGAVPAEYEVEIIFEDGMRYRGHYRPRQNDKASLGRDIRRSLTLIAEKGGQPVKQGHLAMDSPFIWSNSGNHALNATTVLEHYNL